jgi:integrase
MTDELTTSLHAIGELANLHAARSAFRDYQEKCAATTRTRQHGDLALFCLYLSEVSIENTPERLLNDPESWRGMTHGLVAGFVRWQLLEGYAIGSINVRLSTVKRYCALATSAGVLTAESLGLIQLIKAFRHKDGRNVDQGRAVTRIGDKKAAPVALTTQQVERLKYGQPETPQGARDAFLLCLIFDHALRRGEVAQLTLESLNLEAGLLRIYREKTDLVQLHQLTPDSWRAARRYFELCRPGDAAINPERCLIMGGNNKGQIAGSMSDRAITKRVNALCRRIGVQGASAHDGRHYCATALAVGGTDVRSLQDIGGWKSATTALRYINATAIANKGARYGEVK